MTIDELAKMKPEDMKRNKENDDISQKQHITKSVATGKNRESVKLPWFLSILLPGDDWSISDLIEYRIKPGIRSGLHSMIVEVIDRWFDEDSNRKSRYSNSYVSYSRYSNSDRDRERARREKRDDDTNERRKKVEPAFCEIEFDTRREAQDVFDTLEDAIDEYKILNMADVFVAAGMETKYTDYNYGWKDISRMYIERKGSKYVLVMPKAQPID